MRKTIQRVVINGIARKGEARSRMPFSHYFEQMEFNERRSCATNHMDEYKFFQNERPSVIMAWSSLALFAGCKKKD